MNEHVETRGNRGCPRREAVGVRWIPWLASSAVAVGAQGAQLALLELSTPSLYQLKQSLAEAGVFRVVDDDTAVKL